MSLKAKIEAVIYAAEEPVTLAQLAGLFAEEALEEKRAREAAVAIAEPVNEAAVQIDIEMPEPVEQADGPVVEDAANGSDTSSGETEEAAGPLNALSSEASPEGTDQEAATVSEGMAIPSESLDEPAAEATAEEEKKAARLREREVRDEIRRLLQELIADYAKDDRGMEVREIAGGFRVGTKPEYHDAVRGFVKSLKPPMKLSLQALETLAVIAYKQPVTAPEVGEIRGVDSAGVIGSLISRKLIATAGRKQVIGRPILYKTSKEFLLRFGLKDIGELPSMEEFEKMAADELAEPTELPFEGQPVAQEVEGAELDAEEMREAEAKIEVTDASEQEDAEAPGIAVRVEDETVIEEAASAENTGSDHE